MAVIHQVNVHQHTDQECGKIKGGGTCTSPLRIELYPEYAAGPEAITLLRDVLRVYDRDNIHGNCSETGVRVLMKHTSAQRIRALIASVELAIRATE